MKKTGLNTALSLAIATASSAAYANGLALNEQSASGAGTAFAGRASTAQDASILYGNPAGMSRLKQAQVSGGAAYIDASTDINHAQARLGGTSEGDMVPKTTVPFGYYVQPVNNELAFGLGVYAPFGVKSDYEAGFGGRLHGLESEVQVVTVQPTVSYKLHERVSVGLGLTWNKIDGKLTSALPGAALASQIPNSMLAGLGMSLAQIGAFKMGLVNSPDTQIAVEGDDDQFGYNLGVLVALADNLDWGVTYHSKLKFDLDGYNRISGSPTPVPALGIPALDGRYNASLEVTMPESVDTSLTLRLDDWTLMAGTTWTSWSRLQSIDVQSQGVPTLPVPGLNLGKVSEQLDWEDTWSFGLGANYQLNNQWVLRTGFSRDQSPTRDVSRTVRIPVGNRQIYALGAGWTPMANLTLDFAYTYIQEDKAKVMQATYQAEFENSANILSAQATWRF